MVEKDISVEVTFQLKDEGPRRQPQRSAGSITWEKECLVQRCEGGNEIITVQEGRRVSLSSVASKGDMGRK